MSTPAPEKKAEAKLDGQTSTLSEIAELLGVPLVSFLDQSPSAGEIEDLSRLVGLWRGMNPRQRRELLGAAHQIAAETP